jgi:hypothetical protein
LFLELTLLRNSKSIYTDWHKTFPGSGQGKQYPWLLDRILANHRSYRRSHGETRINKGRPWQILLDYGCGKGNTALWLKGLVREYPLTIDLYDPGHPDYRNTELRDTYDCVYTCDVLEHIEREDLAAVIAETQTLSRNCLHIIDLTPAKKHLPDGRNAHVTLMSKWEWIELFEQHEQEIVETRTYRVPDPNYTQRERLCICTQATKQNTKQS